MTVIDIEIVVNDFAYLLSSDFQGCIKCPRAAPNGGRHIFAEGQVNMDKEGQVNMNLEEDEGKWRRMKENGGK